MYLTKLSYELQKICVYVGYADYAVVLLPKISVCVGWVCRILA